ncbi:MAG: DUF4393 domain-containing protein [Ignavibacteriae bacterium]|nr:DUF4393 domain-containing protein [Ignavibacteriota bacterium]
MESLGKVIDSLNIPKQLLDKSEALLKALFGPSLDETSGLIADQVRLRRFKNQVKIFSSAQVYLSKHNLDPKRISLRTLAPLIEYSSLEEDEYLQDKWARLIANIVTTDSRVLLEQNAIEILKTITAAEAQLLESIFKALEKKRQSYDEKYSGERKRDETKLTTFSLRIIDIQTSTGHAEESLNAFISSLLALGTIKWDVPDVEVDVSPSRSHMHTRDYDGSEFDVDVNVSEPRSILMTELGVKFVRLCTMETNPVQSR